MASSFHIEFDTKINLGLIFSLPAFPHFSNVLEIVVLAKMVILDPIRKVKTIYVQ